MNKVKVKNPKAYTLRKKLIKDYDSFGWASSKNEIPKKLIINFFKASKKIAQRFGYSDMDNLAINLDKNNKEKLKEIFESIPKIKEFKEIESYLLKKVRTFKTIKIKKIKIVGAYFNPGLPKDKRLAYRFHQESSYLNAKYKVNKTDILSAHFPLIHNANKKNGSMSALSKSHLEGNHSTINITGKKNGFKSFTPKNIKKIEKRFEEVQFKLDIGDVLFFTKNLIHKSNFNYSNKCRFIGIIRFIR